MLILALETSGKTASVCLVKDDVVIYESYLSTGLKHSEILLQLVKNALDITNCQLSEIELFAITTGPGSFTGLRVGISLIKGFALPFNTKCVGVSTLDCLSEECKNMAEENSIILSSIDARRQEVYYSLYQKQGDFLIKLCEDSNEPAINAIKKAISYKKNIILIGDGSEICYNIAKDKNNIKIYNGTTFGRAYAVANVGKKMYLDGKSVNVHELLPNYLKLSQAEQERANRL